MLAGKNYIASSKVTGKQVNKNDIMTGESITVKGTQLAYLLPAELLGTGEQSYQNPMDVATFQEKFAGVSQTGNIAVKMDTPVAAWGGKTLRDLGSMWRNRCRLFFIMSQVEQIMYISI